MTQSEPIKVNMIRQYLFCRRIPFLQTHLEFKPPEKRWMEKGSEFHEKQTKLFKYRGLQRFGIDKATKYFNTYLYSEKYNLSGVQDLFLELDEAVIPVEFKLHSNISKGHIYQTVAYAILGEEHFLKSSEKGFILFEKSGKVKQIEISPDLKIKTISIIEEIRTILEKDTIPHTSASIRQCSQCEYINYCNDRF